MSDWKAKRFWKEAAVVETDGGHTVELDGRPVKTPAKRALVLPSAAMAAAVAAEWQAQEGEIKPHLMPVTKTANSAIDKVSVQHDEVAELWPIMATAICCVTVLTAPKNWLRGNRNTGIRCWNGRPTPWAHGWRRAQASCTRRKTPLFWPSCGKRPLPWTISSWRRFTIWSVCPAL